VGRPRKLPVVEETREKFSQRVPPSQAMEAGLGGGGGGEGLSLWIGGVLGVRGGHF